MIDRFAELVGGHRRRPRADDAGSGERLAEAELVEWVGRVGSTTRC